MTSKTSNNTGSTGNDDAAEAQQPAAESKPTAKRAPRRVTTKVTSTAPADEATPAGSDASEPDAATAAAPKKAAPKKAAPKKAAPKAAATEKAATEKAATEKAATEKAAPKKAAAKTTRAPSAKAKASAEAADDKATDDKATASSTSTASTKAAGTKKSTATKASATKASAKSPAAASETPAEDTSGKASTAQQAPADDAEDAEDLRLPATALLFQAPDPSKARPRRRVQAQAGAPAAAPAQEAAPAKTEDADHPAEDTDSDEPAGRQRSRGSGRQRGGGRSDAAEQPRDKRESDKRESDKQDADKQDADKQPGDKQDADKQDADKQQSRRQPAKQDGGKQGAADERRAPQEDSQDDDDSEDSDETSSGSSRRRRRRGGRGRRTRSSQREQSDDDTGDEDDDTDEAADDSARRRRRRRPRDGGDDDGSATSREGRAAREDITALRGSTRLESKRQRRRDGRDAGRRRTSITEAEFLARREAVDRDMFVRQQEGRTQIAVLEDDVLVEHYVASAGETSMIGNVYLGRVQNVLPSMEAAFVDIGKGRNAIFYAGEVNWDAAGLEGQPRRIEQALSSGDSVLVQVTKEPIGHKGARLTGQITLAGRFLVLVPSGAMTGISRKLPEQERARLKKLLKEIVPKESGVIVRTAAEGATEEQLRADVERLTKQWEGIEAKAKSTKSAPALLRGEPELGVRVVRDVFNEDFRSLTISGDNVWEMISDYVGELSPELVERMTHWTKNKDLFAEHRIDEQLAKGLERKVYLPSGGSLVIDRTEAMTVVDVNTGKFTGSGGTLEETVTKNNLEAAEEVVRQLRLRDIGGIIVIDFIDMVLEANRDLVMRRLIECLGRDRTRHQVAEVTSLGLVQMTRKRVGEGLVEAFSEPCPDCSGRGYLIHDEPVAKHTGQGQDQDAGRRRKRGGEQRDKPAPERAAAVPDDTDRRAVKETLATIAAAAANAGDKGEVTEPKASEPKAKEPKASEPKATDAKGVDAAPTEKTADAPKAAAPRSGSRRRRVVEAAGAPTGDAPAVDEQEADSPETESQETDSTAGQIAAALADLGTKPRDAAPAEAATSPDLGIVFGETKDRDEQGSEEQPEAAPAAQQAPAASQQADAPKDAPKDATKEQEPEEPQPRRRRGSRRVTSGGPVTA